MSGGYELPNLEMEVLEVTLLWGAGAGWAGRSPSREDEGQVRGLGHHVLTV